jgi:hypothetical protein
MNEQTNSLLGQILAEQIKQTEILLQMAEQQTLVVQLLSDDGLQPGDQVVERPRDVPTYLDGSPVR